MTVAHEFPYPYSYYDEKTGKVRCQLCGKAYLVISPTHVKKHGITYDEYKMKFPDAPLSTDEFKIRGTHGKFKDLFEPKKQDEEIGEEILITEEEYPPDDIVEEIIKEAVDEEEEKIKKLGDSEKQKPKDPIKAMKRRVYDGLSIYFSNVKADYVVEDKTIGGKTKYSYITDFCDPMMRIIFEFPNTFWHNTDFFLDPMKYEKLRQDGWKIIVIKSKAPTVKDIERAIGKVD